jgi:hypothetical protein
MRLNSLRRLMRSPVLMPLMRALFQSRSIRPRPAELAALKGVKVLVLGIYLGDRANCVAHLARRFAQSDVLEVEQRWLALGPADADPAVAAVTRACVPGRVPKFTLLNRLIEAGDIERFDHIVFSDDDAFVQRGFLDRYIRLVRHFGFSVAQPARSWHSHYDHEFVLAKPWLVARETRFVEIGPVFCFDRAAARLLLPFDESSPMGWGYDYVWPAVLATQRLRMGVIDAVRVDHSIRPQAATYRKASETELMAQYIRSHPHVAHAQSQVRLQDHPTQPGDGGLTVVLRRLLAACLDHDTRRPGADAEG